MAEIDENKNETVVMSEEELNNISIHSKYTPELDDSDISVPGCEIISKIGSGGMGRVFLARQVSLRRLVAIKVLNTSHTSSEQIESFMEEAATMAALNHPNVVACYDIIRVEKHIYVIMEYVPGQMSVHRLIKRFGRLPEDIVVRILRDIVNGLRYITSRGYIHHDLKPDNLLVCNNSNIMEGDIYELFGKSDTCIKICDFGIATHVKGSGNNSESGGNTTKIMGTPNYMAPEQLSNPNDTDYRVDIYSLACTAIFMLTGKLPFDGEDRKKLFIQKLTQNLPEPNELDVQVNPRLSVLIGRMGMLRPEERCQSYDEILNELDEIYEELPKRKLGAGHRNVNGLSLWKNAFVAMLLMFILGVMFLSRSCVWERLSRQDKVLLSSSMGYWNGGDHDWSIKHGTDRMRTPIMQTNKRNSPITCKRQLDFGHTLTFKAKRPGIGIVRFEIYSGWQQVAQLEWNKTDDENGQILVRHGSSLDMAENLDASEDWVSCSIAVTDDYLVISINDENVASIAHTRKQGPPFVFTVNTYSTDKLLLKEVFLYKE